MATFTPDELDAAHKDAQNILILAQEVETPLRRAKFDPHFVPDLAWIAKLSLRISELAKALADSADEVATR